MLAFSSMKKKKPEEQTQPDFKNNPFKSLKGFAPAPVSKPLKAARPPAPARPTPDPDTDDEAALFFRAVDGARRIDPVPNEAAAIIPEAPGKPVTSAPEDNTLFLQAMQKIGTTFRETEGEAESEDGPRQSPTSRLKQLKRGTIRISEELDLHGFVKEDAVRRLEHFILNAFSRGQKAVLVITGKGINSSEGPVLQGAVADWLRNKGKGIVAEFAAAPRELGGSGAVVVFLKKQRG